MQKSVTTNDTMQSTSNLDVKDPKGISQTLKVKSKADPIITPSKGKGVSGSLNQSTKGSASKSGPKT